MNYENIILLKQPNTRKIWNKLSAIRFEFHKIFDKCGYEKSIVADSMMLAVGKISFSVNQLKADLNYKSTTFTNCGYV